MLDENDRPARPWLTVILDDHFPGRRRVHVFLGSPSAMQTALALRPAVWRKADPGVGGLRVAGRPVQRQRDGFHNRPHCAGVRRREGCADSFDAGRARGRGKVERFSASQH